MKSIKVLLIACLSLLCISLNAQFFVGGNVGFNASGNNTENGFTTTDKGSSYAFNISPYVGKFLSEKFAAGLALNLAISNNKSGVNFETQSKSSTIGVSPFLRYYAIKWNKLSVYGQANIGLEFTKSNQKTGGITTVDSKATRTYLTVVPVLAYAVNDKFSLVTALNILSFGYSYSFSKDGSEKYRTSTFNAGARLDNIVSVGNLTIGAIYKF
jgi:hypothetical protein